MKMKLLFYGDEFNYLNDRKSIYLAGPTDGTNYLTRWRSDVLDVLKNENFDGNVILPELKLTSDNINDFGYDRIVDWEINMMNKCDVILFWIPRDLKTLPGFTTNIEFGEFLHSNKIVVGSPENAEKVRYLKERCRRLNIKWNNTLEDCVKDAIKKLTNQKIFFTSDTHFGSERILELSKRPFLDVGQMDKNIINRWNSIVTKNDVVYFLGDFGNIDNINYLNFKKMYFLLGNYDKDIIDVLDKMDNVCIIEQNHNIVLDDKCFCLIHEPERAIDDKYFYLFGHIHKLQMVKVNGLNVGMDCHNFMPIDEETVLFYYNAIMNHYDDNVFMDELGIKTISIDE